MMGNIFISYSHKDGKYVRKLEKDIKQKGFDVWIDERIDYGTQWPKVIQKHLDECDAFIVVVSENSFESEWVQNEVARAKRTGKPFFPILLSGDPWLSTETTQYVDVRGGKLPPSKFYDRLSGVVSKHKTIRQSTSNNGNVSQARSRKKANFLQKRLLFTILIVVIPIITVVYGLLYFSDILASPPNAIDTAVAQTQIAMTSAAGPTQTANPNRVNMVIWMNNDLAINSPLESTLDAEYHVIDLSFPNLPNSSNLRLQVDVSCMCMNDSECCNPERTFMVIVESMKRGASTILSQVPFDVSEVLVICSNYHTKAQVGAVSAPWHDVKGYLQGTVSGYQLGALAKRVVAP